MNMFDQNNYGAYEANALRDKIMRSLVEASKIKQPMRDTGEILVILVL